MKNWILKPVHSRYEMLVQTFAVSVLVYYLSLRGVLLFFAVLIVGAVGQEGYRLWEARR